MMHLGCFKNDPLRNVILSEEDRPLADDPDESKDPYTHREVSTRGFPACTFENAAATDGCSGYRAPSTAPSLRMTPKKIREAEASLRDAAKKNYC